MPSQQRQRKKERRDRDAVPMSAFADIAFLLIIFFILTATLNKTKGIITEIPAGEKSEKENILSFGALGHFLLWIEHCPWS